MRVNEGPLSLHTGDTDTLLNVFDNGVTCPSVFVNNAFLSLCDLSPMFQKEDSAGIMILNSTNIDNLHDLNSRIFHSTNESIGTVVLCCVV